MYSNHNQQSLFRVIRQCQNLSRREVLKLGISAFAFSVMGGLTACSRPAIKVAIDPWCAYQFVFLAAQEGLISTENIELIKTKSVIESVTAFKQGSVDALAATLDEAIKLRDYGFPVSIVLVFDSSAGADAILVKPEITRLADLKGKRIAIENSSLGAFMLSKVLAAAGLERNDVNVVVMEFNHEKAWDANKMDAIITYVPALNRLQAKGLVNLFDSRRIPGTILDVLAVRTDVIEQQAEHIRQLIAGHFLALNLWRNNPYDTNYRFSKVLGIEAETVNELFQGLELPDMPFNREYLSPPALELNKSAFDSAQFMLSQGILKKMPNLDNLFLPHFLPGNLE